VVWLARLLNQQGLNVGIISRGYGGTHQQPMLVNVDTQASECGDEPKLIVAQTHCLMAVGQDRVAAADLLIAHAKTCGRKLDIIVSDDGLQHYRLKRAMEVVVIDGIRRFGNGHLLPMGPMREGEWRSQTATLIINNGGASGFNEEGMVLVPEPLRLVGSNEVIPLCQIEQTECVAMAGIGYPQRFFDTLEAMGIPCVKQHSFADHQAFTPSMLNGLASDQQFLFMTEKDAVKCQHFAQDNWVYVPVEAKLTLAAKQKILDRLKEIL